MSLLETSGLRIDVGSLALVKGVDLQVDAGEIVALTGESGSGKSLTALSLMRLVPRVLRLSGSVRLEGRDLMSLSEPAMCDIRGNEIGMIFQEPMTALNPVQTIGDQVAETLRVHGVSDRRAARQKAAGVLERVGLPADRFPLTRYPHELSGGQRQRVVIAMAIALRPKLLIADEPTTALDVTTQAQILDLLRGLVREFGMGLLIITHDLAVVSSFADRILVMQSGKVVERGPARTLFSHMTHPYTRQLFEASRHKVDLPSVAKSEPLLEVHDAVRSYALPRRHPFARPGTFRAVDGVSLSIGAGERVGLVGESGCGKSTLTRAILGLDPLQEGSVTLAGHPVLIGNRPQRNVRRRMQVVFQDPYGSFNPRHRVGRLITEPFHLLDHPPNAADRSAAIARALTDVGLQPEDAEKYPHAFSGGQRQRIAIARALINDPDLIVFDEAVSALDVSVRAKILDLLADLCRTRSLAYLFISHDLSVVRSVTDRVLVMKAGRIVEEGPSAQVFATPQHPYTKELIAAVPTLPPVEGAA